MLFSSTEDVVGRVAATLYFLNEEGQLTAEERTLDLYEGDTQVSAVVRAAAANPVTPGLRSALPGDFQVESVWLEEDICYVNFIISGRTEDLTLALAALERSLLSLDTVEDVQFLQGGALLESGA